MAMAPTSCSVVACAEPASPAGAGSATVSAGAASDLSLGALLGGMFAGKITPTAQRLKSAGKETLRTARHTAPRQDGVSKLCLCLYLAHC